MGHSHGLILTWNFDLSRQTHTMMHRSRFCLTRPTALIQARGATAAQFNRAVYERLKPGGSYVIVDHAAAAGAGASDAQSLHRIEPASVREEVEAAGFVLDAESAMLANKDDPHSVKVFDPSIKGETDRFAYRFVRR